MHDAARQAMSDADGRVARLANGVRLLALPMPQAHSASVSVFVAAGSAHESRALNGISHVAEHMVFKGTRSRDVRAINLDAERLGAEVNAHTDKDHCAFHMRGLPRDVPAFLRMLAELVTEPTFPEDELERERQVLLQEYAEEADDPLSQAQKLFDRACFGLHPAAQPVIGSRRNIERFTRADLGAHVARHFTGANVVVGVAGPGDPQLWQRGAEQAFGAMPAGTPGAVSTPDYAGGTRTQAMAGSSQTHVVMGYPLPPLAAGDEVTGALAAALFGEGMSSPLLAELREKRGLVYYAACSADQLAMCGQFVVEASMAPEQLDLFLAEATRLLHLQAERIDPVDLERARNQLMVRRLRQLERPGRRLEGAALELLVHGRVQPAADWLQRVQDTDAEALRAAFERMVNAGLSLGAAGHVPRGTGERLRQRFGAAA